MKLRNDISIAKTIGNCKVEPEILFALFPSDVNIISHFLTKLDHSFDVEIMLKEKEAFRCLWLDLNATLRYLLSNKTEGNLCETTPSQDKGKSAFIPIAKQLTATRKFYFGALLESEKKQMQTISEFVESIKGTMKKFFKRTRTYSSVLKACIQELTSNKEKTKVKRKIEHIAYCLSHVYNILSNVLYVTKKIDEDAYETLISSFRDDTIPNIVRYLSRTIISQARDTKHLHHAVQLNLLLLSITEGKLLQSAVGYMGLEMTQNVYTTIYSPEIEKLILNSYIFQDQPFYHLLFHRENKRKILFNKILMQTSVLFTLAYIPAEDGKTFIDYFLICMNDLVQDLEDCDEEDIKLVRGEILKPLDFSSFHTFFQIFTKVCETAVINAPCYPLSGAPSGRFFIRLEEPLELLRHLVLIFNLFQQCEHFKSYHNASGELLAQACITVIPKLQDKVGECIKYRAERGDLSDALKPTDFFSLIEKLKQFCDACFSLCDRQKRFSNVNSPKDGKLRQTMLKLFSKQHDLEIFVREVCETNHIDYFKDNALLESNKITLWNITERVRKMAQLQFLDIGDNNITVEIFDHQPNDCHWESPAVQTFLDKNVLFSHHIEIEPPEDEEVEDEESSEEENMLSLEQALSLLKKRKDMSEEGEAQTEANVLQPRKKTKS